MRILYYDGSAWSQIAAPVGGTVTLQSVWGTGVNDVWAVGLSATILHWDGKSWSIADSGSMLRLNGVWASSTSDVWAVGDAGTLLHYNGAFFTSLTLAYVTKPLRAIWGTSSVDSWAVGNLGSAMRKSGTRWLGIAASEMLAADLNAITGRSTSDVWVAGASGIVLQWNRPSSRNG